MLERMGLVVFGCRNAVTFFAKGLNKKGLLNCILFNVFQYIRSAHP